MDYNDLIDDETWAFINRTGDYYPPGTGELPIADQRAIYNRMCREFFQGYPAGVSTEDRVADGVPVRVYECGQSSSTVLYFHGGGFIVGGLQSHDDICAEICARTGLRVVSVDYRLAPEHKHPAQFEDAWAASEYAARTWPGPVILVGDSAGANLAATVAHHARGKMAAIAGQVLIYPGLGGDLQKGSYVAHANAPMLTREEISFYSGIRISGAEPVDDPTYAPLVDGDFSGLPPTVVFAAECDPLHDDGPEYCDRITAASGKAHLYDEKGLVHGYLRGRTTVKRIEESFSRIVSAIEVLGQGKWVW